MFRHALQETTAISRDVETLTEILSTTLSGLNCTLRGKTIKPPKYSSRGSTIWRSHAIWPQQAPVTGTSAADGLYSLDPCTTMMHDVGSPWGKAKTMIGMPSKATEIVCTMMGGGTQLRDGTVQLTNNIGTSGLDTALVLDDSCGGVQFRNMKFTGGLFGCSKLFLTTNWMSYYVLFVSVNA